MKLLFYVVKIKFYNGVELVFRFIQGSYYPIKANSAVSVGTQKILKMAEILE